MVELVLGVALVSALLGAGFASALMRRSRRRQAPARIRGQSLSETLPPAAAVPSGSDAAAPTPAPVIFVSYSHQDGPTVDQLVAQIEEAGYPVWIDRHSSSGSHRYAAPIVGAIKAAKLVALMCSRHAFESDHVIREVYVAGDYKKPFIAFLLDPSEFPDEVRYFVSGFPRVPVAALDPLQLRSEIARLVPA